MSEPVKIKLEAGIEYHYCTCSKSADKVFCDGSHQGTEFVPKAFSVAQSKEYYLCACKRTANTPFCDGSHSK